MRGPALAFDLPGLGRSERPGPDRFDYAVDAYARFVERLLERLGIGEYPLVVHDWGVDRPDLSPARAEAGAAAGA